MSDSMPLSVRPVDRKRLDSLNHRAETPIESADIWFLHSVLCQCFLPYKDPKTDRWQRTNGDFSISLVAGDIKDPRGSPLLHSVGLPYGPKPRLFQSYICMKAIKYQSPVVPVERSMSDMMHVLGLGVPVASVQETTICRITVKSAEGNEGLLPHITPTKTPGFLPVYCCI
jgi:hypothetical protein